MTTDNTQTELAYGGQPCDKGKSGENHYIVEEGGKAFCYMCLRPYAGYGKEPPVPMTNTQTEGERREKWPSVEPRRLYDEETFGDGYLESDKDFVLNNIEAAVWFLENATALESAASLAQQTHLADGIVIELVKEERDQAIRSLNADGRAYLEAVQTIDRLQRRLRETESAASRGEERIKELEARLVEEAQRGLKNGRARIAAEVEIEQYWRTEVARLTNEVTIAANSPSSTG